MENNYRTETDYLPINRWLQDERPREKLIKKDYKNDGMSIMAAPSSEISNHFLKAIIKLRDLFAN